MYMSFFVTGIMFALPRLQSGSRTLPHKHMYEQPCMHLRATHAWHRYYIGIYVHALKQYVGPIIRYRNSGRSVQEGLEHWVGIQLEGLSTYTYSRSFHRECTNALLSDRCRYAQRVAFMQSSFEQDEVCQDTINLLVKGTVHTRMKVIGGKTMVKTSATSNVGCLTKSLKEDEKMKKMNKSKLQPFSGSRSSDAFQPLRGYLSVEKCWNRIAKCPETLRTRAFASLEGFRMYVHYGRVGAIHTQRVYQLTDTANLLALLSQHSLSF